MTREVRVLGRAERDLLEISAWLVREAPHARERILDALLASIEQLGSMATPGIVPHDEVLRARGYRLIIVRKWLVFFKVRGRRVTVYRVLHGKRDWLPLVRRARR